MPFDISTIAHPQYTDKYRDWLKWRYVYQSGQRFIENYLKKFSSRETQEAFTRRKEVTYNPAFAKEAIDEIKNSIFQRLIDIKRLDGSTSYQSAIAGTDGGIDLCGNSMNSFIGQKVLPELLVMSKLGIFVDMPALLGETVAETSAARPYIYMYRAEDIKSWVVDEDPNTNEFANVLLKDYVNTYDEKTGLTNGIKERYRHLWIDENTGYVNVQFCYEDERNNEPIIQLNITRIPFMVVEISDSLLADVANYQIALLNLASADIAYALSSNFPFYVEQYDPRTDNPYVRKPGQVEGGQAVDGATSKAQELRVGTGTGRKYPIGSNEPSFIHPSAEPLRVSMEKQEQMKQEIRQLVNLAVTNLMPKMASAASKQQDQQGLESGLSYIGLALEFMERKIAEFWAMYEVGSMKASVFYPETYDIRSEVDKQEESKNLITLITIVPSKTFHKAAAKQITKLTLSRKVSSDELEKIYKEIDSAKAMTADSEQIAKDVEIGILDLNLASEIRGYPSGTVEKAAKDHADRLSRIQESQAKNNEMQNGGARGVPVADANPSNSGAREKKATKDTTTDPVVTDKTRGTGK